MQSYRRVGYEQRCQIYALLQTEKSVQAISHALRIHRSTIYRELKRNQSERSYIPQLAHASALWRRRTCSRKKLFSDPKIVNVVTEGLKQDLSPEQIAGRSGLLSHQTIYYALRFEKFRHLQVYLRRYGKRRGRGRKGRRKPKKTPDWLIRIQSRPEIVARRKQAGHWERDTMYVKDRKLLLVCLERKSRYVRIEKLRTLNPVSTYEQSMEMMQLAGTSPRTITNDNGCEFMGKTDSKVPIYFCNPYSPYERGSVENTIGLIRQYLKRNTDIEQLDSDKIRDIERRLNHRPRKCLNYKTPHEVMFEKLSH
jgi:IS30 family transposase